MSVQVAPDRGVDAAEVSLRRDLARGDLVIEAIGPVLHHLLTTDAQSIFADDVIATVRGMLTDIAAQLLGAAAGSGALPDEQVDQLRIQTVAEQLLDQGNVLRHLHAAALEAQLSARLEARLGLEPVLSPLLQALIGANANEVAETAMAFLAAQARFIANTRKMRFPLTELPGELLHDLLIHAQDWRTNPCDAGALAAIKADYDEGRSRLGLLARLVAGLGGATSAALSVTHAGVAIFLSSLACVSGQAREGVVLATSESQITRLALTLRAAGLSPARIAEQIEALHPDAKSPHGVDSLTPEQAAICIARSLPRAGL